MTYAWHFIARDKRLGYGDGMLVVPGETLVWEHELDLCHSGLHASVRALDALTYAIGRPFICRVRMGGVIVRGVDKLVASERTCLWMLDAAPVLHEFACWCAESVLHLARGDRPVLRAAIDAKRGWLRGEVSNPDLDRASDAAWGAASAAASDAAWGAASAAASAAASGAARDAARGAARGAAWGAAWDAAAWGAAWDAAAWDRQNAQLEKMLKAAHREIFL